MANSLLNALLLAAVKPSKVSGNGAGGLFSALKGGSSTSGNTVTTNSALKVAAVWSCVRLIAETIATLPLGMYRRLPDGGREAASDHTLHGILALSPNAEMTSVGFWEAMVASMLLWGNAYAQIHRSGGRVIGLTLLLADKMATSYVKERAQLKYEYAFPEGGKRELAADEVLHIPAFSLDGLLGLSPISYGANVIGAAQGADDAASATFKNGLMPTVAFKVDRVLKPTQREDFRQYVATISGALNAGRAPVLEQGVTPEAIGINPADAQLLESRGWSVEEICRLYRVPPWMVGHTEKSTSWGTGIEQQMIGFLTFTLGPWLRRIERGVGKKLLPPQERGTYYAEFALEGLLRADSAARAQFYSTMTQNGIYTRDDCRVRENLPRRGGNADVLTVQTNLSPIDLLGQTSDGQAARAALHNWLNEPSLSKE